MSNNATKLPGYSLVRISGADRNEFLQGQLTQDIYAVTADRAALTGWATAKGRLLMTGQLIAGREHFLLPLPTDISETLIQRLRMYVLRARVTIELVDDSIVGLLHLQADKPQNIGGLILNTEPGATASNADVCISRVVGDPSRAWLIGDAQTIRKFVDSEELCQSDEQAWALRNIRSGLPVIAAATSEAFIPQMVNLDLIGGISFTKGCYIGQEIVARTQNLGRIKRRMYRFGANSVLPVSFGMSIFGSDGTTGKIVTVTHVDEGTELLAVVPISESDEQWFADEERMMPLKNSGLPYSIAEQS